MTLAPGYGETPLDPEEAVALTAQARALLGDDPMKADLYDAEQAVLAEVSQHLLDAVADGALGLVEIGAPPEIADITERLERIERAVTASTAVRDHKSA